MLGLAQIVGQTVEPCPVAVLQIEKLSHGVTPFLRHAAPVGGPAVAQARRSLGMRHPEPGLPFRRRHRRAGRFGAALHH
jgi:hypothetical protein